MSQDVKKTLVSDCATVLEIYFCFPSTTEVELIEILQHQLLQPYAQHHRPLDIYNFYLEVIQDKDLFCSNAYPKIIIKTQGQSLQISQQGYYFLLLSCINKKKGTYLFYLKQIYYLCSSILLYTINKQLCNYCMRVNLLFTCIGLLSVILYKIYLIVIPLLLLPHS